MKTDNRDTDYFNRLLDNEFEDLLKLTSRLTKPESLDKVKRAYLFARDAHTGVFRKTGDKIPYMMHPLAVAKIVAIEMGFGSTTIAAALLHDVVEDTDYTVDDLEKLFGKDVAIIVDGVTKIDSIKDAKRSKQADTFRNFILKMSEDKRIAFVKIADRLHNLRTIEDMSENNKMIKTAESFEIYAPLAHQLGLFKIKKEIEDLSFKNRFYDDYINIKNIVESYKDVAEVRLERILQPLSETLSKNKYNYRIIPLTKSYYKTWQIIQNKNVSFDEINNFLTIRIVIKPEDTIPDKQQCYLVYSYLTDIFLVRDNSLKDLITHPKSNGFEAIITSVMFSGYWFEVQIMTERMHQIAEKGYARHHDNVHLQNIKQWNQSLGELLKTKELTNEEIIDIIKPQDREIYVITPRGDIKSLRKGATVLDFAFSIHSDLGLQFIAAQVDKKIVGYDYVLSNGQEVKIISSKKTKPERAWAESVTMVNHKAILDNYFKKLRRKVISKGEKLFSEFLERKKYKPEYLSVFINKYKCNNKEDFYFRIAKKTISEDDLIKKISSEHGFTKKFWDLFGSPKSTQKAEQNHHYFHPKKPFVIRNLDDVSLAVCCHPLEGDKAMIHKDGDNFIVHKTDCQKAKTLNTSQGQNTTTVKWELPESSDFRAKIKIKGIDRHGLLSDILQIISDEMDINMKSLMIKSEKNIFIGIIELFVTNSKNLNNLIIKIGNVKNVNKVYRSTSFK